MTERISTLMNTESLLWDENIRKLAGSDYYSSFTKMYDKTDWSIMYHSRIHGVDHIERVMLLGSIICMQQGFDRSTTDLVMAACAYHDIARVNDVYDYGHGRRGANKLEQLSDQLSIAGDDLHIIQAAIAVHSTEDELLDNFMGIYGVDDTDQCRIVAKALKDADGLDRVRLADIDVNYLRFAESKTLIGTAVAIYLLCSLPSVCRSWEAFERVKRIIMERMKVPHEGIC